jgi:hypothetical protein
MRGQPRLRGPVAELVAEDGGEIVMLHKPPLRHHLDPLRSLPLPPVRRRLWVERGVALRRDAQQIGELAVLVVVVDDDECAARPQDAHHLLQASLAARAEEVGEPRMYDVDRRVLERQVLCRAGDDCRIRRSRDPRRRHLAQFAVGLNSRHGGRFGGVLDQPEPGAAAEVDQRSPCPRGQLAHCREHQSVRIERLVLQLVQIVAVTDVRCRRPVGKLAHR